MIEESTNDVAVKIHQGGPGIVYGEIESFTYPDGTPVNRLTSDQMREVAGLIEEMADKMEVLA